ncbi:MAG TPA: hypothetical protein VMW41_01240 [Candidatus Bathyarchaeia archaeon]|nr:hypothetical protein [Candidatus Bathyarchaeia archaeon]
MENQNNQSQVNPQDPDKLSEPVAETKAIVPNEKRRLNLKKLGLFLGMGLTAGSLVATLFFIRERQDIRTAACHNEGDCYSWRIYVCDIGTWLGKVRKEGTTEWQEQEFTTTESTCQYSDYFSYDFPLVSEDWVEWEVYQNGNPNASGRYQVFNCPTTTPTPTSVPTPTPTPTGVPTPTPTPAQGECPDCETIIGKPLIDDETWSTEVWQPQKPSFQHTFTRPENATHVVIHNSWQWSGDPNQFQSNEVHELVTPLGTVNCPDFGNEELEGQTFCCGSVHGSFTENELSVTVNFTGDTSSPGSHLAIVKVEWCGETATITPTPTPTGVPTPTPTPTPSASCDWIHAYNEEWEAITNYSSLQAGEIIYFGVSASFSQGNIDGARFRINGGEWLTTAEQRTIGNETIYYISYTIPTATYHFRVEAEVHHSSLGWL